MGSLSAAALLQLPVRLHGIQLGRPVDLLVDVEGWRVLGFVVLCGDESSRFLPYAAAQPAGEEIEVGSALMLLEDIGFYRARSASYRSLLGARVEQSGRLAGVLRDVRIGRGGAVVELELAFGDARVRRPPQGSRVTPSRATAA